MELEDFQAGNTTLKFSVATGIVMDNKKWSETHVSGGGGGRGTVIAGQVNMPRVEITSRTSTQQEFWIREDGTGQELPFRLSGADVPLRSGQRISVVSVSAMRSGEAVGQGRSINVLLVNHDAGHLSKLMRSEAIMYSFVLNSTVFAYLGVTAVAAALVGAYSLLVGSGVWFVPCAVVVALYVGQHRKFRAHKALSVHLEELGQAVHDALPVGNGPS